MIDLHFTPETTPDVEHNSYIPNISDYYYECTITNHTDYYDVYCLQGGRVHEWGDILYEYNGTEYPTGIVAQDESLQDAIKYCVDIINPIRIVWIWV